MYFSLVTGAKLATTRSLSPLVAFLTYTTMFSSAEIQLIHSNPSGVKSSSYNAGSLRYIVLRSATNFLSAAFSGLSVIAQLMLSASHHSFSTPISCPMKRSFLPTCVYMNAYAALKLLILSARVAPGILLIIDFLPCTTSS